MKTNLKAKKAKKNQKSANNIVDHQSIPHQGNLVEKFVPPKYNSMHAEILKLADPVPFDMLKEFYGLM